MAKKARRQKPKKSTTGGSGEFLIHAGLAAIVASLGLLVAFGLIWWQVIVEPAQATRDLDREKLLNQYVQLVNGRIGELRNAVGAIAQSPTVIAALTANNPEQRTILAEQITSQHPYIKRVDIIPKGEAEVDLNSAVPISFAALDLIRRAETREFVGPEVSLNQQQYVYAAEPITPQGLVAGVLFVVFDKAIFTDPLSHHEDVGKLKVHQKFSGSPSTVVIDWGRDGDLTPPIDAQLFAPHWSLSLAVSNNALSRDSAISGLFMPLGVSWIVLVGGIILGFSRYARKLGEDTHTLIDFIEKTFRGRGAPAGHYNLSAVEQVAHTVDTLTRDRKRTSETDPEEDADEEPLLADLDKPVEPTVSKTSSASNDFLEVRRTASDDNFGIEVSEEEAPAAMGLDLDPGIFRAYDIRGITTQNLTEEVVYWIGRAFAAEALNENCKRVCVGWDGRHSSMPLQASLTRGLNEGGADVITIGQVPTPMLYYATYALDTGTGIMITGSHNPPEYNGLKMMIGGVTLAEGRILQLLDRIQNNNLSDGEGDLEEVELDDSYIDKILEDVAVAQPLKVVVDCGNGVAGKIAPRLLTELGCDVVPLYCEVDGNFPNHHPDPAEPENLEDLMTVVKAEGADLGLAFDGDGDRVGVVTNRGEIIWPDKLLMLFAQDIVSRNPGADIIYDVKCSRHLNNIISELGGRPIMWKTGHSHIKAKIKETGALLGGEFSGHICFAERWYGFDDALYSAARLVEIIGADGREVDEIFAQYPVTYTTPELKITTTETEKFKIMQRLEQQADFGDGTLTTIDGIRVDFADGWGLIRPSNTSPVLSLRFEADGPAALDRIQDEFQTQLTQIAPDLSFR